MRRGGPKSNKGNFIIKTKKFPIERYFAIVDYFLSIEAEGCRENRTVYKTADYMACVRNIVLNCFR